MFKTCITGTAFIALLFLMGGTSFAREEHSAQSLVGEFKECKECAKLSADRRDLYQENSIGSNDTVNPNRPGTLGAY
jgi:hypothetical protein